MAAHQPWRAETEEADRKRAEFRKNNPPTPLMVELQADHPMRMNNMIKDEGHDVNEQNHEGSTCLLEAARLKNHKAIRILLENGATVDLPNNSGFTPLIMAGNFGSIECVKLLLAAGANVNAQNQYGATALHCAAFFDFGDTCRVLLEQGADSSLKNNIGNTALDKAKIEKCKAAVEAIEESDLAKPAGS